MRRGLVGFATAATVLAGFPLAGDSWIGIGGSASGPGISATPGWVYYQPTLRISPSGHPAVTWSEGDASGLDPRVRFLRDLGLIRGHLLVGDELVKQGRWMDALPHFHHPAEELYGGIAPVLKKHSVRPFDSALNALAQPTTVTAGEFWYVTRSSPCVNAGASLTLSTLIVNVCAADVSTPGSPPESVTVTAKVEVPLAFGATV